MDNSARLSVGVHATDSPSCSPLRIFIGSSDVSSANIKNLSPVVAFHRECEAQAGRLAGRSSPFAFVEHPSQSDVCALPMRWNYYIAKARQDEAVALADQARSAGKRTLIWFTGDLPPIIPIPDAIVFRCSVYRSRQKPDEFAAPHFIDDPTPAEDVHLRRKSPKPLVGFCGYAGVHAVKMVYGVAANIWLNVASMRGRSSYDTAPLLPATLLRARTLRLLARDPHVDTRFIIRDRYRAGHRTPSPASAVTVRDFFSNIVDTDYTVCVRGYGNFSIRFYETLACGRIPIFVDTDCVLPFESSIDWKKYCVWVDKTELRNIGEKVAAFHDRLSEREFRGLQLACRALWKDCLSLPGFMGHLRSELDKYLGGTIQTELPRGQQ